MVIATFSADGKVLPGMIVYPYQRVPKDVVASVPKPWAIGLDQTADGRDLIRFQSTSSMYSNHFLKSKEYQNIQSLERNLYKLVENGTLQEIIIGGDFMPSIQWTYTIVVTDDPSYGISTN